MNLAKDQAASLYSLEKRPAIDSPKKIVVINMITNANMINDIKINNNKTKTKVKLASTGAPKF